MQSDMDKARAAYQDFLTLWKNADFNIPISAAGQGRIRKITIMPTKQNHCRYALRVT